jgi:D-alanine-D-alanine ligase
MTDKLRVGVIFGGQSGEHEVSLQSARSVMSAINREKYEVVPIGISPQGRWLTGGDSWRQLAAQAAAKGLLPADLHEEASQPAETSIQPQPEAGPDTRSLVVRDQPAALTSRGSPLSELDVVFPVLHGPLGEDGTVQGLLELAGVPYVGAGVLASAVGMDKALFKDVMRAHGIPVVDFQVITRSRWEQEPDAVLRELESVLRYPCFVKPANLGSSVGISKARNRAELTAGLREAAEYDRRLLVEDAINAREIEVSVLGNDDPVASVAGEVIPSREFYDYAAKYQDGDASRLIIPAPISPELKKQVQSLAMAVFRAIDGSGMARVDFLLDRETERLYVNEANTIPGFTAISMYPKLWAASGLSYSQLIDRLIGLALERYEDKRRCRKSFDVH